jgi:hypothetical protein
MSRNLLSASPPALSPSTNFSSHIPAVLTSLHSYVYYVASANTKLPTDHTSLLRTLLVQITHIPLFVHYIHSLTDREPLKMRTTRCVETSGTLYPATECRISEDPVLLFTAPCQPETSYVHFCKHVFSFGLGCAVCVRCWVWCMCSLLGVLYVFAVGCAVCVRCWVCCLCSLFPVYWSRH